MEKDLMIYDELVELATSEDFYRGENRIISPLGPETKYTLYFQPYKINDDNYKRNWFGNIPVSIYTVINLLQKISGPARFIVSSEPYYAYYFMSYQSLINAHHSLTNLIQNTSIDEYWNNFNPSEKFSFNPKLLKLYSDSLNEFCVVAMKSILLKMSQEITGKYSL
jgi:hypothetical protein